MVLYREYLLRDYQAGHGPYYSDLLFYDMASIGALVCQDKTAPDLFDVFYERDGKLLYAAPYRISHRIQQHGLPPTYLLHGDADAAVGVEQADEVAGAILGCGLTVEYEGPHGEDHFLDNGEEYQNPALYNFVMQ
ncbi:hypothetical protein N7474_004321 [Penicillium riverlandense]|uniref:uncharacterized protein n=1 Tax=Penicillium riverlandense TaxID=1903569 RepID=UPI002547E80B|nr:uncharacterized protein N7474_004321 [Penicillium riverlandense]KAJ5818730.1 hypothetical protein N7474_004321 [Penicillium riverlandense]